MTVEASVNSFQTDKNIFLVQLEKNIKNSSKEIERTSSLFIYSDKHLVEYVLGIEIRTESCPEGCYVFLPPYISLLRLEEEKEEILKNDASFNLSKIYNVFKFFVQLFRVNET